MGLYDYDPYAPPQVYAGESNDIFRTQPGPGEPMAGDIYGRPPPADWEYQPQQYAPGWFEEGSPYRLGNYEAGRFRPPLAGREGQFMDLAKLRYQSALGGPVGPAPVVPFGADAAVGPGSAPGGGAFDPWNLTPDSLKELLRRQSASADQAFGQSQAQRGGAFADLSRLVDEPAYPVAALVQQQGNALRFAGARAAAINQATREAMNRAGIGGTGRGVEMARRTRAEMGPEVAGTLASLAARATLANAAGRREGLARRAEAQSGWARDPLQRDYGGELQTIADKLGVDAYSRDMRGIMEALRRRQVPGAAIPSAPSLNAPATAYEQGPGEYAVGDWRRWLTNTYVPPGSLFSDTGYGGGPSAPIPAFGGGADLDRLDVPASGGGGSLFGGEQNW